MSRLRDTWIHDSDGTDIIVDADGRLEVSVGDSTGADWLLHNGGMPVNMRDSNGDAIILDNGNLPVVVNSIAGIVSTVNSSILPLGVAGVFTGTSESITDYADIKINVFADQAGVLLIEQSTDGTNWDFSDSYNIPASSGEAFSVNPGASELRVTYTNGPVGQVAFRLQTIYKSVYSKPSSHKVSESVSGEDDAELVKAVISGEDENGIWQNARVSSAGFLITTDFLLAVAEGHVPGHTLYRKFGRIQGMVSGTEADCWEFGGVEISAAIYTWSTTAAIDSMSSDNAADTQIVTIVGTILDGSEVTQTKALNGQNIVTLDTPLYRVNRVENANGSPTLGNVYVYENTPIVAGVPTLKTMVRGYFSIKGQQSLQSIYTVPLGKTAYLYELKTSMGGRKTGFATYEAYLRTPGRVFLIKDTHDLSATGTSSQNDIFAAPRPFPEKTDFKPLITVDTTGIGFGVSFVVILVDN